MAAAAKQPVVVALLTATPLDISKLLANPKVGAILHLGQPSVTVLGAGPLLYGDRSPAGRTIQTIYPSAYQDQISIFDFGMRPGPSPFARPDCTNQNESACPRGTNPGRTYRFYTGDAVVPFGFGLSYTTFKYSQEAAAAAAAVKANALDLAPLRAALAESQSAGYAFMKFEHAERHRAEAGWTDRQGWGALGAQFSVNVTNTGKMDADDVVLGFLTPPGAGKDGVALKQLFGFERVHVPAGETREVFLYPQLGDFMRVEGETQVAAPGAYRVTFGVQGSGGFLEAGVVNAF